jgi:hypothetical protein
MVRLELSQLHVVAANCSAVDGVDVHSCRHCVQVESVCSNEGKAKMTEARVVSTPICMMTRRADGDRNSAREQSRRLWCAFSAGRTNADCGC